MFDSSIKTAIKGDTGADGSDGAAATVAVGSTTTGAAGSSASVTNSGTSSAATFDFTIPKGDTGATGSIDLTADQTWTGSQRGAIVTGAHGSQSPQKNTNDGDFDMNGGQNFKCTPSDNIALTFTNMTAGQSGYIILDNNSDGLGTTRTITSHSDTLNDTTLLDTVSAEAGGVYILSYLSDGSKTYITNSAALS